MSTSAENPDYLLDNADPRAEDRFEALGHLFDARTIAYLAALGVTRDGHAGKWRWSHRPRRCSRTPTSASRPTC
jgi:hypothetical protein